MKNKFYLAFPIQVIFILFSQAALSTDTAGNCHYSTYKWNVNSRSVTQTKSVTKLKSELTNAEVDIKTGCSVCEEDQTIISISGLREFKVCKLLAPKIKNTLELLIKNQQPIWDVVGYRTGMSRGDVDAEGNRTQFSNHSFGIAIDINTDQNGLYDRCVQWSSNCRLIKGGAWNSQQTGSWTSDSMTVKLFKENGFLWGGEIEGQQKDFMHFSPTGY